ncbi:Low temperature viability protein [Ascobolus immersus RN42]|uniref:Low temperature viability protein n=1 Tax=Ascobolus immersus RN42 TaxID=1160509 RepID=A0A3N4HY34_ASCIM|nr:Low temperature viability protein [Ascobolus immersus RN42]
MAPGKKKWIDKKTATTFALVHRPQTDPLINDPEASDMVFTKISEPAKKPEATSSKAAKVKTTADLEEILGEEAAKVRKNEGQAAEFGIFYDDTKYDYMQHLRDIEHTGDSVFLEAPVPKSQQKGKQKMSLDEAIRAKDETDLLPKELLASDVQIKKTYQDQQNIPDAIAGFKPDMDLRLREVLEALEDEAFVDPDAEDDFFQELTAEGEAGPDEFFDDEFDEDDGWQSDDTVKAKGQYSHSAVTAPKDLPQFEDAEDGEDLGEGGWLEQYKQFKKDTKAPKKVEFDDGASSMMSFGTVNTAMTSASSRRRRRKGRMARSETSNYSMTSSSLFRTEGLSTLDARFDKIEEEYEEDDEDDDDLISMDGVPVKETRLDFDNILDEFLDNYHDKGKAGRKVVKKGKYQTGLEQLDEIRSGLGKARIRV